MSVPDTPPTPAPLATDPAVAELLGRFAHHAFTPLHVVGGALELADHTDDLGEVRAHLRVARTGVRQALRLSQNLLNVVQGGPRRLSPQVVEIAPLLRSIAARWRPQATAGGGLLAVDGTLAPGTTIATDVDAFGQLLDELLDNSLTYGHGGLVTLAAEVVDHRLTVSVHDDGPGVEDDLGTRAFEALTVGAAGRRRNPPGLGLGLAAAAQLATALGGELVLQPRNGRPGSLVVLRLPA